jgi:hypothetical protein
MHCTGTLGHFMHVVDHLMVVELDRGSMGGYLNEDARYMIQRAALRLLHLERFCLEPCGSYPYAWV